MKISHMYSLLLSTSNKIGWPTQVHQESCRNVYEKLSLWNPSFLFLMHFLVFSSTYSWPGVIPCHLCRTWACSLQDKSILLQTTVISPHDALHSYFTVIHVFSSDLGIFCFDFNWYITYFCSLFLTTGFTLVISIFLGNTFIKNFIVPSKDWNIPRIC